MSQDHLRLLLVDDENSLREPLARHLELEFGFEVNVAANYEQAMELVVGDAGLFDVALIDRLLIPPPDGIQLMRDIKASYPDIECIIATGWGTEDRQLALQEGAFRYIEKPFDLEELAALIRAAAQQARLRTINREVLSKRDLESVLRQIVAAARSLAQADAAEIQLLSETTDTLQSYGTPGELAGKFDPAGPIQQLTRKTIAGNRTESYPNLNKAGDLSHLVEAGFQSLACVPIPGAAGSLGTLLAYSRRQDHFGRWGNIGLLQTLADQAGLAIANATAFEETQELASYMELLVRTTGKLTQTTDRDAQLGIAWSFVRKHLRTPVFLVALVDDQNGMLEFPFVYDTDRRVLLEPLELEEASVSTIAGHVVKTSEEFYCPTAEARRQRCSDRQIESTAVGDPCETCLYVPLVVGNDVLGAISVQSYEPHAFSHAFLDTFRSLAHNLAIAIANANLVLDIQKNAGDLQTLLKLSRHVASSLEPGAVLTQVCQAAVEFFRAEHSGLVLFEEPYEYGTVAAEYPPELQAVGMRIPLRGIPDEDHLLTSREPLVISCVAQRDELGAVKDLLLDKLDIQSTIIVPVVVKDTLLGSFSIDAVGHERIFTSQELELARSFAAQVAVAIDHARLFSQTESRARLLGTLDEISRHIRAEKDPERLLHEIVRLAAELVGCESGCLLKYERYRGELEITEVHQIPPEFEHQRLSHNEGIIGLAAQTGERKLCPDYEVSPFRDPVFGSLGFTYAIAIPIRPAGEVEAVLFLADARPGFELESASLETLERFANQAAIALHTSQLLNAEQRALAQQEILLKISDYIQAAGDLDKILHVVLTGVTAGYGLSFNRAALFLLDDSRNYLVGRLGIGHYDEATARADWLADQQNDRDDFGRYVVRLENEELKPTPVGDAVRHLALPTAVNCVFAGVMDQRRYQIVHARDQHTLQLAFVDTFQPAFPLVVVPLIAHERAIGILVADNKFTNAPVTEELMRSLLTFANTAAIAIENRQLFEEIEVRLTQVERTREAAGAVAEAVVRRELHQTLNEIADRTRSIMAADIVTLYAYAESVGRFTAWGFSNPQQRDPRSMVPPKRLKSLASSPYRLLNLVEQPYYRLVENGDFDGGVFGSAFVKVEEISAAIGIQLRAAGQKLGVMYVNFRSPHQFAEDEISTIQLFADLAAAAIRSRQLYDEANHRASALQGLVKAGQVISGSLTLQETLDKIAAQALVLVGAEEGDGCACHIAVRFGSRLRFAAASSPAIMQQLGRQMPTIDLRSEGKIGIVGRVALSGQSEIVPDVLHDPDYIPFNTQTRSELVVPMKQGEQLVGVINVESPRESAFVEDDRQALTSLAAQAAIAIQDARLYEREKLVADLGREANSLELQPFLDSLFGRLSVLFSERDTSVYPLLAVYAAEKRALQLIPTSYYPTEIRGTVRSIDDKGIMAWVAKHGRAHYAPDVNQDAYYNPLLRETASEYAVPVHYGDRLLGVLALESPVLDAFGSDDQALLQTVAHQIASTLHNVQQYEELRKTRGLVGTREALAWMGMISNVYRHEMNSSAAVIRERLRLLRDDLGENLTGEVSDHLASMERVAHRIQSIPLAPPLSSEEGVQPFPLCDVLRQRLEQLLGRERHEGIQLRVECAESEPCMVRASPEWIKRFIDQLVVNASDAMAGSETKELLVQIGRSDSRLEVRLQDTGKGIPEHVREHLFKRPVPKRKGEKGSGVGLLMAQLIIETYGGGIHVESSSDSGTTMLFWLPVEEE